MENLVAKTAKRQRFDLETFCNYLIEFKFEYGNCLVPQKYITANGYKLGEKVSFIRYGSITTTAEQKEKLNNLGFVWIARYSAKIKKFDFDQFMDNLKKYKQEFGNLLVKIDYVSNDGFQLGFYVRNIRTKNINLTEKQKQDLVEIGFVFDTHDVLYKDEDVNNAAIKD